MTPPVAADLTICKCCGKPLRWYQQFGLQYGECVNADCARFTVTRELHDLAALTETDIEEFLQATRNSSTPAPGERLFGEPAAV